MGLSKGDAWQKGTEDSRPVGWLANLADIPNFCAHEHWGSIDCIGIYQGCFLSDYKAGALPARSANLLDILLDPYLEEQITQAGIRVDEIARDAGAADIRELANRSIAEAFRVLAEPLSQQKLTGVYQSIRRGLKELHGTDIANADGRGIQALSRRIGDSYRSPFRWYRKSMAEVRFSRLIRPVHPEFCYLKDSESSAADELAFTHSILRIDPLLALWPKKCPRRDILAELVGIEPGDAGSWRAFLERLFDDSSGSNNTGIKQLQAYRRSLDFVPRTDGEVDWSGELSEGQQIVWEDWMVHECCKQAHERGWPHQVHVGTHNLRSSSPLPLENLGRLYPRMKIVQIHCWPFLEEAGWLAKNRPNFFVDTCWLPILNPSFFRQALETWINYLPVHKIMCSQDATTVEMAVGSSLAAREIIGEVLAGQGASGAADNRELVKIATGFLHNNAVEVYGIGEKV